MASSVLHASHWIVAVPNELGSSTATLDRFKSVLAAKGVTSAELSSWNVPMMKVGTLDSLLSLADELARADTFAEGVVRKVERQISEAHVATKLAELSKGAGAGPAGGEDRAAGVNIPPLEFRAGGLPSAEYVRKFAWDAEQYDAKEPLPDLLRRLVSAGEKVDADVRAYGAAYAERRSALTATERRRAGNLMVCGLEEVITPSALDAVGAEFVPEDSEYLSTLVLVVPRVGEEAFLACYEKLDREAVPMGADASDREALRGSPVVPRSARRIAEDKDGYVLYTVTILKKFGDSFRAACRERRFTVRDFTYDPAAAKGAAAAAAAQEVGVRTALAALREAGGRKYTEAMSVWMHVKAVRVFVECVLRYGLPVNFCAVLVRLGGHRGSRKALEAVHAAFVSVTQGGGAYSGTAYSSGGGSSSKAEAEAASMVIPGVSDGGAGSALPFVLLDFEVRADTAAQEKGGR